MTLRNLRGELARLGSASRKKKLHEIAQDWYRFYSEKSWQEHKAEGTAKQQFCKQFKVGSEDLETALRFERFEKTKK